MLSARNLFELVGIELGGEVAWGEDVPTEASGVYVIAIDVDPATFALRPEADEAEQGRWSPDQAIVYVVRATSLRRRLREFRRHRYGDSAPHR